MTPRTLALPPLMGLLVLITAACTESTPAADPSPTVDPTQLPSDPAPNDPGMDIDRRIQGMTLEEKVGQMLMFGFGGNEVDTHVRRLLTEWKVGGVALLGHNVGTPEQIAGLTARMQGLSQEDGGTGLLIAIDQEGGRVLRLPEPFTQFPDAATVGATRNPDLAYAMGRAMGEEMRAVGLNLNLAPVLDVRDSAGHSVIGDRSFGYDPELVSIMGTAFIDGLQDVGVIATGKHFPGHGSAPADSHRELPVVRKPTAELRQVDLAPFADAVGSRLDVVMTAHAAYPDLDGGEIRPATLSPRIISDLLHGELGFDGVVLTDSFAMEAITNAYSVGEAAVLAVEAGADVIVHACGPGECSLEAQQAEIRTALLEAVRSDRLSEARIDASVSRILALKQEYGVGEQPAFDPSLIGSPAHRQAAENIRAAAP